MDRLIPPENEIRPGTGHRRALIGVLAFAWLLAVVGGLSVLGRFDNTPGTGANAPGQWPAASRLSRSADGPTLVLLAHPQCSCTRASLDELTEALARVRVRPKTYVLFLKPEGFADGWEQTETWRLASAIPGVTAVRDESGREARRFGAATSGETLLYDAAGTLVFSGGITGSRGHAGDNYAQRAIAAQSWDASGGPAPTPGQPHRDATSVGCRCLVSDADRLIPSGRTCTDRASSDRPLALPRQHPPAPDRLLRR